jgi:hypothetical protein
MQKSQYTNSDANHCGKVRFSWSACAHVSNLIATLCDHACPRSPQMAVLLETSMGDITIDLHYDKCPRTVTNFLALCKVCKPSLPLRLPSDLFTAAFVAHRPSITTTVCFTTCKRTS